MTITHVTASVTASGGGIPVVLQCLAAAQSAAGLRPRVIGHQDGGTMLEGWPPDCPSPLPTLRIPGLPWAAGMAAEIRSGSPEILHSHGLWSQASVVVPAASRRGRIPYVVSPHGMLDSWALANARWKKRIAAALFEDRHLHHAACLIALCQSEADSIRSYGLRNPIAVIPNGVDLPEARQSEPLKPERKILLFLGRLHPKKGLVNALKAWSEAGDQGEWQFVIAGWDQGGHEAELKALCAELEIAHADVPASEMAGSSPRITDHGSLGTLPQVIFTGPAFGEEKDQLLRAASAFILPSFSEGLPMSVLEAWAYGLPVLMTDHCNLPEGFAHHAAIRIGTDVESIAAGLRTLFAAGTSAHPASDLRPSQSLQRPGRPLTSDLRPLTSDLQSLGRNGRTLVERQFTWPQVARQTKQVYDWVLGQGPKPGFVFV